MIDLQISTELFRNLSIISADEKSLMKVVNRIYETEVVVLVLATYGHYNDK